MHRPVAAAVAVVAAIATTGAPALAQSADDLPPRISDTEPRVLDVPARVLDVEARIVDVVVPGAGGTEIPIGADVLFAFGSAELGAEAQGQLAGVVERIRDAAPSVVRIEGHTDSVGDDAANQRLSEQRAEAVRNRLGGALGGVAFESSGFGEARPVAPNELPDGTDNPAGRQQNRRVTIVLLP